LELARSGAHVIALARTQGALEELDDAIRSEGSEATLVPCDLKDFEALDRLGAAIFERWGKLDIFIGNAGVLGPLTPLAHVAPDQWDAVVAVNVTANWRLIRSLDPLLRAAEAGRVGVHFIGRRTCRPSQTLLGAICGDQAALDAARPHLCGGNDEYFSRESHGRRSRAAADKDAGGGHARRRPDEFADTGRTRRRKFSHFAHRNGRKLASFTIFQQIACSVLCRRSERNFWLPQLAFSVSQSMSRKSRSRVNLNSASDPKRSLDHCRPDVSLGWNGQRHAVGG